jgi:aromatic ring-opening dioxygenase catalytic subunit (LigB family)
MAQIVAAMASVHVPLLTSAPHMADQAMWEKIHGGFNTLRETLTASGADTVVVISDEHFNALDPRRYPTFGVVAAETGVGPVENWLGIPRNSLKVNFAPDLAEAVLREGALQGFDLTRVGEAGLEHGFVTVLNFLTPKWDLSYLWLIQNCVLPPLPSVKRCYEFGRMVGNAIRKAGGSRRVAILGTGGLSHAVGTPDMGKIDPKFDKKFLKQLCANSPALRKITDAEMDAVGNGTHEIRNWVAVAGAVEGAKGEVVMYETTMAVGFGMMQFQVAA